MGSRLDDAVPVSFALQEPIPPAAADPAQDRDWLAVAGAAIGLTMSTGTLALYSFGVFARPLMAEFGWSRTSLFTGLAFFQYSLAFASLGWGVMTDRFGPRRVISVCLVGLSCLVGSLAFLTPHLWHLYLVFAAIPLLGGAASPLGYSAVVVRLFDRKLGLALGLSLMGVGIGAAVLPPLAQFLLSEFGWRTAYASLGVLTFAVTLPAALVATRNVPGPARGWAASAGPSLGSMLRTRAYVLMAFAFMLLGVVTVGTLAHLVPMMVDLGVSPADAARIAGLSGLAVIVGRGGLGWVLDRVHAPYVLAAIALVAGSVPLVLAYGEGPAAGYLAAVLLGSALGAEIDLVSFLIRRYFGQSAYGRLYGIAFGLFSLGSGTGPVILGSSFDHLGDYKPGLVLFAVLAVVVAALALAMPAYAKPERRVLAAIP